MRGLFVSAAPIKVRFSLSPSLCEFFIATVFLLELTRKHWNQVPSQTSKTASSLSHPILTIF